MRTILLAICLLASAWGMATTTVELRYKSYNDSQLIAELANYTSEIENLYIEDYEGYVTDTTLNYVAEHFPGLKILHIMADGVTDTGLASLAQYCTGLQELVLDVDYKGNITDNGVSTLVASCTGLIYLDLCREPLLTDAAVSAIAQNCSQVQSLYINCLSIADMKDIANNFDSTRQTLANDSTAYHGQLTDASLTHLTQCSKLTDVDVTNQPNVSYSGLVALAQGCSQLDYVEAVATEISIADVITFHETYPNINVDAGTIEEILDMWKNFFI